jgi:hypothetical protein
VRHNPAGGWIRVATGTRGGHAYLEVANGGPALPADLVPLLFEPFRRANGHDGNGDGTGLGLSIVRSVATAHAGSAVAHGGPAGGLEVSVLLPADPVGGGPASTGEDEAVAAAGDTAATAAGVAVGAAADGAAGTAARVATDAADSGR